VRDLVIDWSSRAYQAPAHDGPFSLLVFGGSQGARFFSDMVPPALALLPPETRAGLFVVQQCREEDLAAVEQAYRAAGVCALTSPRFSPIFPRRWPRRISSLAGPAPLPLPS
jgi:UDP-N-acetylglucosamine--N-acetylmuramyl-(pentapeptide) pyrophosphoryl-undecaprenol N-acetylglucosamine transferase